MVRLNRPCVRGLKSNGNRINNLLHENMDIFLQRSNSGLLNKP